jgi:hypothetical protein
MMTPEGRVKKAVTAFLKEQQCCWWFMPVVSGMGGTALDYAGVSYGRAFMIETKRPGGKLTARQRYTEECFKAAGGKVFIVDTIELPVTVRAWFKAP